MKDIIHIFCFLILPFFLYKSNAQALTPQYINDFTLEDKVSKSDLVVEGEVINGNMYGRWTDNFHTTDGTYNSFIIRVSKIFKGEVKDTIIELVISALPSSSNFLGKENGGIFFLKVNNSTIQSGKNIQSFLYVYPSSYISFVSFNSYGGSSNPYNFEKYIFQPIEAATKQPRKTLELLPFETRFYCKNCYQPIPLSEKIQPNAPLSLEENINKSDVVIEGEVIDTVTFSIAKRWVYTSVIIKVSRIFKGSTQDTVELIIDGGRQPLGGSISVSKWGIPEIGDGGIYFLRTNDSNIKSGKNYPSYFYLYPHSLIEYSDYLTFYEDMRISDFDKDLYQPIEAITHTDKVIGTNSYAEARKKGVKRDKVVPPKREFRID